MTVGVWVLGDQLWLDQAALQTIKQKNIEQSTPVILIESIDHIRVRPYHQQKLVLVWSAMRHFAETLEGRGFDVTYCECDRFSEGLRDWVKTEGITELRVMAPVDKPFSNLIAGLELSCEIVLVPNNQFMWTEDEFKTWAAPRKRLLMEDFYRESRKRFDLLMDEKGKPVGGAWNFDKENRKPPKKNDPTFKPPIAKWFKPDEIVQTVLEKVKHLSQSNQIKTHGSAEEFGWAVNRSQALQVLDTFIETRLSTFGPYEDAMVTGQDTLWHSMLSPYLNLGLLTPIEVVKRVESEYNSRDDLEISSVEGFIRQVIGWREYMRGIYAFTSDDDREIPYAESNWFNHQQSLPDFFWDSNKATMNCLKQCLSQVERTSYNHHIQRLMILNNFALIAGYNPQEIENWFHSVYIDAYDWVMQTNVIGMGQYADGGLLASKPYASSANYVNKMSDYCKGCQYDFKSRTGEKACPFNYFYWDFLDRHREKLSTQGRMSFILKNLDKMAEGELEQIRELARSWHQP
jgi:deoxyribodipyrimidine photolyase-related protein